jgi:hypothetical protein
MSPSSAWPLYSVSIIQRDGDEYQENFDGPSAYREAIDFREAAMMEPLVLEILLRRLHDEGWRPVGRRMRQNADGAWEETED